MAAISAVYDEVTLEDIRRVAENFSGVEHRIEFVKNVKGVEYYNDSIASTPTRTISGALSVFDKKIILIAGGYDKNISFDDLGKEIIKKVKTLILLGNTSEKIYESVINACEKNQKTVNIDIVKVLSMQEAVGYAYKIAASGDTVVLSPACASFDLYENFEKRGNHFKQLILSI
jgi:UDP-N-acetylmuramoylalanine--D-glutamate ligase